MSYYRGLALFDNRQESKTSATVLSAWASCPENAYFNYAAWSL
jgi:hypothetical protein